MKNSVLSQSNWLRENDISYLQSIFHRTPGVERVRIFGSRAKGNWRSWSDIDLAIEGNISHRNLSLLKSALQYESPFPFSTDVIEYSQVNQNIREHIDRVGQVIYSKDSEAM